MDANFLTKGFQTVANQLDKKFLTEKDLKVWVGTVLNCYVLKIYKEAWTNPSENPATSPSRIFFSIWVDPDKEHLLFYNIHALRLRQLKGFKIESRRFAETFRKEFKQFSHKWENVSTEFGPLTLMQGFVSLELKNFEASVLRLFNNFLEIEHMIEKALGEFKL